MNALFYFGEWAASLGRAEMAAMLLGAVERAHPQFWAVPLSTLQQAETVARAEAALGPDAYADAVARGAAMELAELLELVRGLEDELRSSSSEFARAVAAIEHGGSGA